MSTADPVAHDVAGTESDPGRVSGQAWRSLALVSAATCVIILDMMAVNVAFPFIEHAFPSTPRSTLAWISSGYADRKSTRLNSSHT